MRATKIRQQQEVTGARRAMAALSERLVVLEDMTVAQLREEYRRIFGEPTRSHNRDYLRKKVAWRIQAQAEGGLSQRALDRIEELAPTAPVRWRRTPEDVASSVASPEPAIVAVLDRDPRLPPAGTVLTRTHQGVVHQVAVLETGFEYQGRRYASLSRIAREITGTAWNGFGFFSGALRAAGSGEEGR